MAAAIAMATLTMDHVPCVGSSSHLAAKMGPPPTFAIVTSPSPLPLLIIHQPLQRATQLPSGPRRSGRPLHALPKASAHHSHVTFVQYASTDSSSTSQQVQYTPHSIHAALVCKDALSTGKTQDRNTSFTSVGCSPTMTAHRHSGPLQCASSRRAFEVHTYAP